MNYPQLVIDLQKIEHNARTLQRIAAKRGVCLVGVTKGVLGDAEVAKAMLAGGVGILADTSLENIARLRQAFPATPLMLLRTGLSRVEQVVALADISLNADLRVLQALADEAVRQGKRHKVILMVETGALHEGVWPGEVPETVKRILGMKGLEFLGLGAHFSDIGGGLPGDDGFRILCNLALEIEQTLNAKCQVVSGGSSATLSMLLEGRLPSRVNQLRVGEGLLLGTEPVHGELLPGLHSDAMILQAEVAEICDDLNLAGEKIGAGPLNPDPQVANAGCKKVGVVEIPGLDVPAEGLIPRDPRVIILGAGTGGFIVDLAGVSDIGQGSVVEFRLRYAGLLGAMASPAVSKRYII